MGTIAVVGSVNADLVIKVPALPKPGETVLGGTFFQARGGKGANQAVAAARAGGSVTLIAAVGDDPFGEQAVEGFRAEGIDTGHLLRVSDAPSGVALIVVDEQGENSIAVAEGANARLNAEKVRKRETVLASADLLVVQLEVPLDAVAEAVRVAAEHGTKIVLNPAPAAALPDEVLGRVSVLTPNLSELERLTGIAARDEAALAEAASVLLAKGIEAVVFTLGPEGAYVATRETRHRVPGWRVTAEDTTGAGDVFNGALAVSLAEGAMLPEAVRFANAAAAISVTRRGAQPSAPVRREILDLLARAETGG